MDNFHWAPEAIYEHCRHIANMPVTTKESLEDLIGETSDHASKDAKKGSGSQPERVFYYNSISSRLQSVPYLSLLPGEFVNETARKHSLNRELVFGEHARVTSSLATKAKETCKTGGRQPMSCVCCHTLLKNPFAPP